MIYEFLPFSAVSAGTPFPQTSRAPRIPVPETKKGTVNDLSAHAGIITKTVDQELLLRNEYLSAENRIFRAQIRGRLLLSEVEKATLAEIAQRLGRKALKDVAAAAKPDTLMGWYRQLIAKKFDRSKFRKSVGGPPVEDREAVIHLGTAFSKNLFVLP